MNDLIPPLPADVDRASFGHWLSGFVDGEGCFWLGFNSRKKGRRTPCCRFIIGLREDDSAILRSIQSYFGTGILYRSPQKGRTAAKIHYTINTASHLLDLVIPHFERFPLRSKKARDFLIWRTAVLLHCSEKRRGNGMPRWSDPHLEQFAALADDLRRTRELKPSAVGPDD